MSDWDTESDRESSERAPIVGIDLGTTNSLCAVFENGKPRLIKNAHGEFLTPSVVGMLEDDQVVVGAAARELRVTKPDRCASTFKRYMGTDRKVTVAGREFTAPELSALVLKSLKQDAEADLGVEIEEAVITVPAYFNDGQRKATRRAGEIAGLKVRRIVNEPTAAALTYGFHDRDAEKKLLVIDLGGGTFDVTLMEVFEGTLEIVSTAGESFLGGEDFTDRLVSLMLKQLGLQMERAEMEKPLLVARLRQECEVAKRAFLEADESRVRIPEDDGTISESAKKIKIDKAGFAKAVEPLVDRLRKPVAKALRDGETEPGEVDDVILVGGATRMPVLVDFVKDFLRVEPKATISPDEVVALGAAVQAALIEDDAAVDDMVMTDVCPFTLGVETVKQFGSHVRDGYYVPVIHRNTTIPVSKEEVFYTVNANQTVVSVQIFQGESRRVADNLKLGELEVSGIPTGPAGQPVHVRFTYDMNGILEVEAFVPESGQRFQAVLTQHAGGMSDDEIEEAVDRMQRLKFYPRDDVRNQRLVLFCERVVGEIAPIHRQELEEAIDFFEHAMTTGDRDLFQAARQSLLTMLSRLNVVYDEADAPSGNEEDPAS